MLRVGGTRFEHVSFPVAMGDRYIQVTPEALTGKPLVDVYRWDHERDRLVLELLRGRPAAGASPVTVEPAGGTGGLRLSATEGSHNVVGYLSGGNDVRSVILQQDRIRLMEGDRTQVELSLGSISGFPIGLKIDDEGFSIACGLPEGFPSRRLAEGATFGLYELAAGGASIQNTDIEECTILGPAVMLPSGCQFNSCGFGPPTPNLIIEVPDPASPPAGVIVLEGASVARSHFDNVSLMVGPGAREAALRELGFPM